MDDWSQLINEIIYNNEKFSICSSLTDPLSSFSSNSYYFFETILKNSTIWSFLVNIWFLKSKTSCRWQLNLYNISFTLVNLNFRLWKWQYFEQFSNLIHYNIVVSWIFNTIYLFISFLLSFVQLYLEIQLMTYFLVLLIIKNYLFSFMFVKFFIIFNITI